MANLTLSKVGHAGGTDDAHPLAATDDKFMQDYFRFLHDEYGDGAVGRGDFTGTYDPTSDTYTSYNFSQWDRIVYWASVANCTVVANCHTGGAGPGLTVAQGSAKVPRITGGRTLTDVSVVSGSSAMQSASGAFTAADVGRTVRLPAGPAGAVLKTQIASVTSATVAQLADAASIGATGLTATLNGVMRARKAQIKALLDRYGPGGTIRAGSTVTLQDGSHVTIDAGWKGIWAVEDWNEPNSIGSAGGVLDNADPTKVYADPVTGFQRTWQNLVYRLARDGGQAVIEWNAANPAPAGFPTPVFSAICSGGVEVDYHQGVLDYGQNSADDLFPWVHGSSMHCYFLNDPITERGSLTGRGILDTIARYMRPMMNGYRGGPNAVIWITESGASGSNSWGRYQLTYGGVTTADAYVKKVAWMAPIGTTGASAAQQSGELDHSTLNVNAYKKIDDMNATSNTRIEMFLPHAFIRRYRLTATATYDSATPKNMTGSGFGYPYWQGARSYAQVLYSSGERYVPASGSPLRSPSWLPVAIAVHDFIRQPPVNNGAPANLPILSDTTPATGETISTSTGVFTSIAPAVAYSYQWQRQLPGAASWSDIAGETAPTYAVRSSDATYLLRVGVTAKTRGGTLTVYSAATAAVTTSGSAPVNTAPPVITNAQGTVSGDGSGSNPPVVGGALTSTLGSFSPPLDSSLVSWEKRDPRTGIITTI